MRAARARSLFGFGLHLIANTGPGLTGKASACPPRKQRAHGMQTQVGYKEPSIWSDVLQGAAPLLEEGGILLLYDSDNCHKISVKSNVSLFPRCR